MRRARHKNSESTYYHVLTRVAGAPDFCPLEEWEACRKLYLMIVHFTRAYGCVLVSLEIMGTHYHFILWMEQYRKLRRPELARRARLLWGEQEAVRKMVQWDEAGWERFNRRLFDLSALMQHLNGEYAKWYNRTHGRHGHFWGDRFKNPELLDLEAVQKCLAYIETNATRAHLIDWPENWEASSTWRRFRGETGDLMPLERIFAEVPAEEAFEAYRRRLRERQRVDEEREREAARTGGGKARGSRERFFSDGLAIGTRENVARVLAEYQADGHYLRRKHPIPQTGQLYTLREQRSHARG